MTGKSRGKIEMVRTLAGKQKKTKKKTLRIFMGE